MSDWTKKPWNGAKTKHISCQDTNLGGTSLHEKKQVQDTQPDTSLQHPPHD